MPLTYSSMGLAQFIAGNEINLFEPEPLGFGDVRSTIASIFSYTVNLVLYVLSATFASAGYIHLRNAVEGPGANPAIAAFD